jgi:hypothetical protein
MSKFWGYIPPVGLSDSGKFALLVNAKGSCSRREFDVVTGKKLDEERRQHVCFERSFAQTLVEARPLPAPIGARTEDMKYWLPPSILADLQRSAGLPVTAASKCAANQKAVGQVGMLHGLDALINQALNLTDVDYRSETAAKRLSSCRSQVNERALLHSLFNRLERNWDGCHGRSKQLWRWDVQPYISIDNTSPEKTLEKAIIGANCGYVNQIPAASGLLRTVEERHISIDLGNRCGKKWYELIELKAGDHADTPLRATFQILGYGLLYCFARIHRHQPEVPWATGVLAANRIDLKVLGPQSFYLGYRFDWLAEAVNKGLQLFCAERFGSELVMHFFFEAFPSEFRWPGIDERELPRYMNERRAYDWR